MPITRSKSSSRKKTSRSSGRSGLSRTVRPGSRSGTSQPARTSYPRKAYPSRRSLLGDISPERKIDIIGVIMALVGLLTTLSLFSAQNGSLTGSWISALKSVFGWGVYILPIGLIEIGRASCRERV
jgi:hypothetical protein